MSQKQDRHFFLSAILKTASNLYFLLCGGYPHASDVTLGDYISPKKSSKNHRYWTNNRLQKNQFIYVNRIDTCIDFFF